MTAQIQEPKPEFGSVTLTMNTQEEFDVVYQIMNCLNNDIAESIAERCDLTIEQIKDGSYNAWGAMTQIYNSNT